MREVALLRLSISIGFPKTQKKNIKMSISLGTGLNGQKNKK